METRGIKATGVVLEGTAVGPASGDREWRLSLPQGCNSASWRGSCSCSSLSLHPTGAGILAMANAGPDTNGSQFFVTLAPTQWLDGKHTIFGRVCQGIGMVNRVGMVETNSQDRPVDDVKILKAYPSG